MEQLDLPDPDDRRVLAAAIQCGATIIVTDNIKDFPAEYLVNFDISAIRHDKFARLCIAANPVLATRVVSESSDPEHFISKLEIPLPETAALLRELLD